MVWRRERACGVVDWGARACACVAGQTQTRQACGAGVRGLRERAERRGQGACGEGIPQSDQREGQVAVSDVWRGGEEGDGA